jgi:hypothetical protein
MDITVTKEFQTTAVEIVVVGHTPDGLPIPMVRATRQIVYKDKTSGKEIARGEAFTLELPNVGQNPAFSQVHATLKAAIDAAFANHPALQ